MATALAPPVGPADWSARREWIGHSLVSQFNDKTKDQSAASAIPVVITTVYSDLQF